MDIAFVSGVMSASLDKLLTQSHLNSFKNMTRQSFLSLLKTHQYGFASQSNIDQIMVEETLKHRNFLTSIIDKDHLIFKVLYISFDHLFLSNLMKSYHLGMPYHKHMDGLSNYDESRYEDYVLNHNMGLLDLEDVAFLDKLIERTKGLDAQSISDQVIKILHDQICGSFNKKTDKAILKYLNLETTILNVMLFVRSKRLNKDIDYLEKNILNYGMIEKNILLEQYAKSLNEFGNYLQLHFDVEITEAFKHQNDSDFLSKLNESFKVYQDDLLQDLSFENLNLAPVIYYTLLKRNEINQLKKLYYEIKE